MTFTLNQEYMLGQNSNSLHILFIAKGVFSRDDGSILKSRTTYIADNNCNTLFIATEDSVLLDVEFILGEERLISLNNKRY